jgi:nanoRNase/pAp phosphatase (c-di-AMP/oligoRNAs hydrolase)
VCVETLTGRTSLRSKVEGFMVAPIAKSFGGGGHDYASGCKLDAPDAAIPRLEEALLEPLDSIKTTFYL